jgi:hypothetical protein
MERSASEEQFIGNVLDNELSDFGLPTDSPIRKLIDRDAQVYEASGITGQKTYGIKVVRDGQPSVTVRERLEELSKDFMYRDRFPPEGKSLQAGDIRGLRDHFDAIARGEITVK